jgi:hypothetical protein
VSRLFPVRKGMNSKKKGGEFLLSINFSKNRFNKRGRENMKTIRITTLVCLFALLSVGHSFSAQPVTEDPVNIVTWGAGYDYRQSLPFLYPGYRVGEIMYTGEEGISGGYFFLAALINPGLGSCLTDHSQIREVKAKWLGDPDYEYSLTPTTCLNYLPTSPFTASQPWVTPLRPAAWMFTGTWAFTLVYDCPDGFIHKQTREVQPNPADTIPPKPTGILVEKSPAGNSFNVSWIGMGNPSSHIQFDYRLSVFRNEDNCPIAVFGNRFGGGWSYADGPNRIKFTVPIVYAGKMLRIEQGNNYGMPLPPPPGTLGGAPNRASVDIRLPD